VMTLTTGGEEVGGWRERRETRGATGDGESLSNRAKRGQEGYDCDKLPRKLTGGGQRDEMMPIGAYASQPCSTRSTSLPKLETRLKLA
jgi:hypothetical protein